MVKERECWVLKSVFMQFIVIFFFTIYVRKTALRKITDIVSIILREAGNECWNSPRYIWEKYVHENKGSSNFLNQYKLGWFCTFRQFCQITSNYDNDKVLPKRSRRKYYGHCMQIGWRLYLLSVLASAAADWRIFTDCLFYVEDSRCYAHRH